MPGEKAEIILRTIPNEKAYDKEVVNKATATADNANPKKDDTADKEVKVAPGLPDGRVGSKTHNAGQNVKAGDTFTYSIKVSNGAKATADWKDVVITDELSDYLEYVGEFACNEKGSSDGFYDSRKHVLTIKAEPIKPGENRVYSFKVKVKANAEGQTIVNIADLVDGDGNKEKLPSDTLVMPEGKAEPFMTKTHNTETVGDLEFVTYTLEVGNKNTATGSWKNVTVIDNLPKEVQMVGVPVVHGATGGDGMMIASGNSITQPIGDIKPGNTVKISYTVQVKKGTSKVVKYKKGLDAVALEKLKKENAIFLNNVASASGNNGSTGASDDKVQVPPTLEPEGKGNGSGDMDRPYDPDSSKPHIEKVAQKTLVDLRTKDSSKNTYTIKLTNTTDKVWKDVKVKDILDSYRVTLIYDTVKVNGMPVRWGGGYNYTPQASMMDEMDIPVGDIDPGETATVEFSIMHSSDNASLPYDNTAVASSSSHKPVQAKASSVQFKNPQPVTKVHHVLSVGYPDGTWRPYAVDDRSFLSTEEAAAIIARSVTAEQRAKLLGGRDFTSASQSLPECFNAKWGNSALRFMGLIKGIYASDIDPKAPGRQEGRDFVYDNGGAIVRNVATRNVIGRMLKAVGLTGLPGFDYSSANPENRIDRLSFIMEICKITGRDTTPDTNGCAARSFSDTSHSAVIESATWHSYVIDSKGNEIWTMSDLSRTAEI